MGHFICSMVSAIFVLLESRVFRGATDMKVVVVEVSFAAHLHCTAWLTFDNGVLVF